MDLTGEQAAIEGVIQTYLDGLYEGDTSKLADAFMPTSALTSEQDGKLVVMLRDVWLDWVRTRPAPRDQGLTRHDQVLSVDFASPTTAFVKLRCAIPPRFFTDYLSLLKIDGRWQVAQKVFATRIGAPDGT